MQSMNYFIASYHIISYYSYMMDNNQYAKNWISAG